MKAVFWRKLVTATDPPLWQKLLRGGLAVISIFYRLGICLRNKLYDRGIIKTNSVNAAVVSIGNITTGGTGKTPLVAWLGNYFASTDCSTAVLTRGYKMKADFADEPAMLAKAAPKVKVIIDPDRSAAAIRAIEEHNAKLLIMDDGFQHRKLQRAVDIVAIDATEPFGGGRILPAGLLREPVKSLKRADAVVITRINQTSPKNIDRIKDKVSKINPNLVFASAVHKPICAKLIKDVSIGLDELAGKKVYAFCGIGNPDAFFQTLTEVSLNIVGTKVYNDHHKYSEADITAICQDGRYKQADMILTTQKDWIKTALLCIEKFDIPIAYLAVELEFTEGRQQIISMVENEMKKYV